MSVFNAPDFDGHQLVAFHQDAETGLRAIIAIHNTRLGPALGGCRMWDYANDNEALADVLRLSRGMTYKSALAELPLGGGKSVIIGDPHRHKTGAMMRAMGRFIDSLGGAYIGAEDSGTSVADLKLMAQETAHVSGIDDSISGRDGDPSPATAYGVFIGIQTAVAHRLRRTDLTGVRVAIQGLGHVGARLARHLSEAGAELWVADIYPDNVNALVAELGAHPVTAEAIHCQEVDVFAPCALGGAINSTTLPNIRAEIVAGAANNQLASEVQGAELAKRGILYAPDYVINAGGIIDVHYQRVGYDPALARAHVERIRDNLKAIFTRADQSGLTTAEVADQIARERFQAAAPEAA